MGRHWKLTHPGLAELPEDRCLQVACAVLQRFRTDRSDRLEARDVSRVATESTYVTIRQIGSDRSRVEVQELTVPAAEGQGGARQLNLRVLGLQGQAGLTWRIGDLDDAAVHVEGDFSFAREVGALIERLVAIRVDVAREE